VLSRFTRSPHLFSPAMVSVELTFTNLGTEELTDIRVSQKVSSFLCYFITVFGIYTSNINFENIICGFFISWVNALFHQKNLVS
jgi:hypothetical protein